MSRFVFFVSVLLVLTSAGFLFGIHSANDRNAPYRLVRAVSDDVRIVAEEVLRGRDAGFVQEVELQSTETVRGSLDDGAYVLLSGYFDGGPQLRIVTRDGAVVRKWPVRQEDVFAGSSYFNDPEQFTKLEGFDIHGALANRDGSVVFSFEYGGMVKMSACGAVEWTLHTATHHSVERAAAGGYWVPGRRFYRDNIQDAFPPFTESLNPAGFREDLILRVSEDGEVLEEKSVVRLLYDAGLEAVLTATGEKFDYRTRVWDGELVHVNSISELDADIADAFPLFEARDLMISLRTYNLVFVVDPDTWMVKWHQTGPWLRQHDPNFRADGRIVIFNNNGYATLTRFTRDRSPLRSNIIAVDPVSRETEILYGDRDGEHLASIFRGKVQLLTDGGLFITEPEGGRALQVDADRAVVWEYVNLLGPDRIGEVNEARLYDRGYFADGAFDCP